VYPTSSGPEFTLVSDTQVQVKLTVEARIDDGGRYAEAPPASQESLTFDLVQDSSGQWRISGLDDGVVLSHANFQVIYRSTPVYFLSVDNKFLVPETRWFPNVNLATSVMQALIAGPSPWLRDGVRTAVPDGVQLTPDAVLIDAKGTASVGLSEAALATTVDRGLLVAQIGASLPQATTVNVTAGEVPFTTPPAQLDRGVATDPALEVIQGDTLMRLVQNQLVPVEGVGSLAGLDVRASARTEAGNIRVMLSGPDTLVLAPTASTPAVPLITGSGLLPPTLDRLGWAWTATSGAAGSIVAVRSDGQRADVGATWLAGRSVRSIRVARDGSRIAVLSSGADGIALDVAAVVRDGLGTPKRIGEPLGVGAVLADASRVVWVDDVTLGVLGTSGATAAPTYVLVPIGGPTTELPALAGAVDIAGGRGTRVLYTVTADGQLSGGSAPTWTWKALATGVRDPELPG